MSRLYWSDLPDANKPRGGTSGLWSSLTTADLPMPGYPETRTSSAWPPPTMRSKVVSARSEVIDSPLGLPLGQAAPKIALNSHRCLIPLLRRLGEQLHRDRGDRGRHGSHPLTGCGWLFRDVTMHPFHRVGGREWKTPGQHFVKRHSERVKVAPRIDRTVHSSRLLGC